MEKVGDNDSTMREDVDELIERLDKQASRYGGNASDILSRLPDNLLDSTSEIKQVMDLKHLAHVHSQSRHPDLKDDWNNIFLQDAEDNLSNAAETATIYEQINARIDLQINASFAELSNSDDSVEVKNQLLEHIEENPPQQLAADTESPFLDELAVDPILDLSNITEASDPLDLNGPQASFDADSPDLDIDWP
jgi:hypothetical protein